MFIDALDTSSSTYLHINVKLISLIGLKAAAYCSEVLNMIKTSVSTSGGGKNLIEYDGQLYLKVNRQDVKNKTSLSTDEQEQIEEMLEKHGLLLKHPTLTGAIILDGKKLLDFITDENSTPITETIKVKAKYKPIDIQVRNRINKIKEQFKALTDVDADIIVALCEWVEALHKMLTGKQVDAFLDGVRSYTDKDLVLRIITVATTNKFINFEDAVAKVIYKDKVMAEAKKVSVVKKSTVEFASDDDDDGEEY